MSATWHAVVPFRILDRAGKMRGSPRDAIVAELSKKEKGKNFGMIRAFDNAGAVAGIVFSILFFGYLGYKKLFLIAAVPSAVAVLLILFFIREKKKTKIKIYRGFSFSNLTKNYKIFLFSSSLFALGSFSYSFLLLYSKNFGFAAALIPVLYLIFTLVASLLSYYFGFISDKIGRKKILYLSYLFWILTCGIFAFARNYFAIVIGFVAYGLHKAAIEPVQKAFVADISEKNFLASSLGTFQMVIGLIALPASFFAGLLWVKINAYAPFYFSIALTILSIAILMFVKEK